MILTGVNHFMDILEKAVTWKHCPSFKTARKLEEIRNFKQGMDETLYQAWERYNDLLFRCTESSIKDDHGLISFKYKSIDGGCFGFESIEACSGESGQLWAFCNPCTEICDDKTDTKRREMTFPQSYDFNLSFLYP
ncbi:hypothetical protein Tco_1569535 [Tanacetum coccineum]